MSEIVDRIAPLLAAQEGERWEALHETDETPSGKSRNLWRWRVAHSLNMAREPTEAMAAAGGDVSVEIWRRMIDQIQK